MPNMRSIRTRMKSIRQTLQITSAMKLISTSKMRRARTQLMQTEPYFDHIRAMMQDIVLDDSSIGDRFFTGHRATERKIRRAFLVITGDKGLAGGYNHNVINLAEGALSEATDDYLIPLGTIGSKYFAKKNEPILETFRHPSGVPTVYEAKEICDFVISQYDAGLIDEFHIAFTHMHSSVKLAPELLRVLPIKREAFALKTDDGIGGTGSKLNYSPSAESVFRVLVPKYITGVIYGTLVQSFASEHSARMTAMDTATKNASDMLDRLQLSYNRIRQSAITGEVTEIVAGAAALNE